MEYRYRSTKLKNGARIASIEMPHMHSASVGIWAGVGGRHESLRSSGIAHFAEHLLFKGTAKRSAQQIMEEVEGVGGDINAYTSEDHTCYFAKAAARHFEQVSDVLADMYLHPTLDAEEIEREREVIREEILMYRDSPFQHVQDLLEATLWPNHPLGRPLTGTIESIVHLKRPQLDRFVKEQYCGRSTIVTVAGNVSHERVLSTVTPWLERLTPGRVPSFARFVHRGKSAEVSLVSEENEQTQLALGFHAFGRRDPRRFAIKLLSVILAENMSSRLFQRLRETHGLCYSIQSEVVALADVGAVNFYAGLEASKVEKALKLTMREFRKLAQKPPSKKELRKAQDYTVGQALIGLESTNNQMTWMGETLLGYGKVLDPAESERQFMAVTAEQISEVARECFSEPNMAVAVVGPLSDAAKIREWCA